MTESKSNCPEENSNDNLFDEQVSSGNPLDKSDFPNEEKDDLENEDEETLTSVENEGDGNITAIRSEIGSIINNQITINLDELLAKSLKTGVSESNNLDPALNREYKNILAHIKNKLRDKEFDKAYEYCQKAEELAPAEPTTWEYFALTEFLREINKKERRKRKPVREIVRLIKNHLEKGKDHGLSAIKYEEITNDIANQLFNLQKARINSIAPSSRDSKGRERYGEA